MWGNWQRLAPAVNMARAKAAFGHLNWEKDGVEGREIKMEDTSLCPV